MQILQNDIIFLLTNPCAGMTTNTEEKAPGFTGATDPEPWEAPVLDSVSGIYKAQHWRQSSRGFFWTWEMLTITPSPSHSKEQSACLSPSKLKERTGNNKVQLNF